MKNNKQIVISNKGRKNLSARKIVRAFARRGVLLFINHCLLLNDLVRFGFINLYKTARA